MARRRWYHRRRLRTAAVTFQSAARRLFARKRCSALRAARLRFWVQQADELCDRDDWHDSPVAAELLREVNQPPPPTPPPLPPPPALLSAGFTGTTPPEASGEAHVLRDRAVVEEKAGRRRGRSGVGRALAEALAPMMGCPPPGCPEALDVDWGDWGVTLDLVFPPRVAPESPAPAIVHEQR